MIMYWVHIIMFSVLSISVPMLVLASIMRNRLWPMTLLLGFLWSLLGFLLP